MYDKYDKIMLTHPILGDRDFPVEVSERIMANPKNGGWEHKQLKNNDNSTGDKGSASEPKKGKHTKGRKASE